MNSCTIGVINKINLPVRGYSFQDKVVFYMSDVNGTNMPITPTVGAVGQINNALQSTTSYTSKDPDDRIIIVIKRNSFSNNCNFLYNKWSVMCHYEKSITLKFIL